MHLPESGRAAAQSGPVAELVSPHSPACLLAECGRGGGARKAEDEIETGRNCSAQCFERRWQRQYRLERSIVRRDLTRCRPSTQLRRRAAHLDEADRLHLWQPQQPLQAIELPALQLRTV